MDDKTKTLLPEVPTNAITSCANQKSALSLLYDSLLNFAFFINYLIFRSTISNNKLYNVIAII